MGDNKIFSSGNKPIQVSKRIKRLLEFLELYKELWYENGKGLECKINLIAKDEADKEHIMALYRRAEEDYFNLRVIRSRLIEHKKNNITTPFYNVTEEEMDSLRQAGVGRSFGLSDENQAEYDRLIKAGVDEAVVQYIFKKFSSYQRFKEIYCEALLQGTEKELLKRCPKAYQYIVSDIDLSIPNGIRADERNYIDFIRDVIGVEYFVFDGARLTERIDEFINFDVEKSPTVLSESCRYIIRRIYGLGLEKMSSSELAKELGISNSRVRQILSQGMSKLSNRKSQLLCIIYLSDQDEVARFLANYFRKNDVFITSGEEHDKDQSKSEEVSTKENDNVISSEMYSSTFARNLRTQMETLESMRAKISAEYKTTYTDTLDRFEQLKLQDFFLGRMLIDRFGLSNRTHKSLTSNGMYTVEDVIKFSRSCNYQIKYCLKNMGDKSYNELVSIMERLGLKLEDDDKSNKTRIINERILGRMCKEDTIRFYLYLEQLRYSLVSSIMYKDDKDAFSERIEAIKDKFEISLSNEELTEALKSRIDNLDYMFNYDTSIEVLDLPHDVIKILKSHGVNEVLDIYRLRDRDVNYLRKKYGAYFDMVVACLNRIGFDFPLKGKAPNNMMKNATFMNDTNIGLIMFILDNSNLGDKQIEELKKILLDKIVRIGISNENDVNKRLLGKVEELTAAYKVLNKKQNNLRKLEKDAEINKENQDDSFGDIV